MTDQLDLDRVKAPAKEPAKAWRNKWFTAHGVGFENDTPVPPGAIWLSRSVYPSAEVAEHVAVQILEEFRDWAEVGGVIYLGPIQVEAP